MKISIQGRSVSTPFGVFAQGDILTSEKYSEDFLKHLVNEAGCATEIIETTKKPLKSKEEKSGRFRLRLQSHKDRLRNREGENQNDRS